ncbi:hypothetical protein [Streptomyces yerevanensis]|uniref:hypothetical protein n=1 Tax=Streptomyces yerevanensis TaxID=66378 RepID=UPI0005247831|nr:hypothetical protein [Streptomyces yerevanensis]
MSQSFEELEAQYKEALNRVSVAHAEQQRIMGDFKPLGAEEPPVVTKLERDAQNEAHQAYAAYIPIRDRYWATRWGREGNPPKS